MDIHEYALLFPAATDDELAEMAADIKQRGLLCPIITLDGKVLDGRNRLRACEMAGVAPRFQTYTGDDPLGDVVSWNLKRRQLSTSQKAALGATLKPAFEEQAKERMIQAEGKPRGEKSTKANLPQQTGQARDQAAAAVGVSGRIVQDAELVQKNAPELFEEVKAGRMTVNAAKQEVKRREGQKREEINDKPDREPAKQGHGALPQMLKQAINRLRTEIDLCARKNWARCDRDEVIKQLHQLIRMAQ